MKNKKGLTTKKTILQTLSTSQEDALMAGRRMNIVFISRIDLFPWLAFVVGANRARV